MKAINLRLENPQPYLACPHCLTEITTQDTPPIAEPNLNTETPQITENQAPVMEEKTLGGEPQEASPRTQCTHHVGYLSERSNKEKIPEECITCAEIVNCMLKAVKNQTTN